MYIDDKRCSLSPMNFASRLAWRYILKDTPGCRPARFIILTHNTRDVSFSV